MEVFNNQIYIAVTGLSQSGKTTTCEFLSKELPCAKWICVDDCLHEAIINNLERIKSLYGDYCWDIWEMTKDSKAWRELKPILLRDTQKFLYNKLESMDIKYYKYIILDFYDMKSLDIWSRCNVRIAVKSDPRKRFAKCKKFFPIGQSSNESKRFLARVDAAIISDPLKPGDWDFMIHNDYVWIDLGRKVARVANNIRHGIFRSRKLPKHAEIRTLPGKGHMVRHSNCR